MCDKEDVEEEQKKEEAPSGGGVDWDTQMEFMEGELESSLSDGNTSKTTIIVNFKVGFRLASLHNISQMMRNQST